MAQVQYSLSRWMEGSGPEADIVISSRVRAARNIKQYPFSCLASEEENNEVLEAVKSVAGSSDALMKFSYYPMDQSNSMEKRALVEKHLISPYLAADSSHGALYLSTDEDVSIMVNEEDHLQIQSILPGLRLEEALQETGFYDDLLEANLEYVFDERYGYLTSCPTNVGTGLRASVMLHLPALIMTGQINRLLGALSQVGLSVLGLYGEGSEITGNLVQISNRVTLGQAEEEIVSSLNGLISRVIEQEQKCRQHLLDKKREETSDRAWRALGILKYACMMSSQEALMLISDLRLGYDLGLVKEVDHRLLNELLVLIQPGCLQLLVGRELKANERKIERPVQVKKALDRYRE